MPSRGASSRCGEGLGPWSCSATSKAWTESSMRFSAGLTRTGKPTPSNYLHRQLDVTGKARRDNQTCAAGNVALRPNRKSHTQSTRNRLLSEALHRGGFVVVDIEHGHQLRYLQHLL